MYQPSQNVLAMAAQANQADSGRLRNQLAAQDAFAQGVQTYVEAPARNALLDAQVAGAQGQARVQKVQGIQAEAQIIAPLLQQVEQSQDPASAYAQAVRQAEAAGLDIPDQFEAYNPENFAMLKAVYSLPAREMTDFERMLGGLGSDEDRQRAIRIKADLEPGANAVLRGQTGDKPYSGAAKLRADLEAGRITQADFDRETAQKPGLRVGKDGRLVVDAAPLGRAAGNEQQKGLASELNLSGQLAKVGELAGLDEDGRMTDPSLLTYAGQAKDFFTRQAEKLGVEPSELQRQAVFKRTQFVTGVEQLFNAYRKEITGAAAAVQELDRLKKSFINMDMSPTQFEAVFAQYTEELQRSMRVRRKLLREGFDLRDKTGGDQMDRLFLSGGDDDPADRYIELLEETGDKEKAYQQLALEGYKP